MRQNDTPLHWCNFVYIVLELFEGFYLHHQPSIEISAPRLRCSTIMYHALWMGTHSTVVRRVYMDRNLHRADNSGTAVSMDVHTDVGPCQISRLGFEGTKNYRYTPSYIDDFKDTGDHFFTGLGRRTRFWKSYGWAVTPIRYRYQSPDGVYCWWINSYPIKLGSDDQNFTCWMGRVHG